MSDSSSDGEPLSFRISGGDDSSSDSSSDTEQMFDAALSNNRRAISFRIPGRAVQRAAGGSAPPRQQQAPNAQEGGARDTSRRPGAPIRAWGEPRVQASPAERGQHPQHQSSSQPRAEGSSRPQQSGREGWTDADAGAGAGGPRPQEHSQSQAGSRVMAWGQQYLPTRSLEYGSSAPPGSGSRRGPADETSSTSTRGGNVSLSWADDMRHQPNESSSNMDESSASQRQREVGGGARGGGRGDNEDGMRPPMEMENETWGEATSSEVGHGEI